MVDQKIPNVDFSLIPEKYAGLWVLIRVGDNQKVLSSAQSPDAVISQRPNLVSDSLVVLTKVPNTMRNIPSPGAGEKED